jgi:hypothetical protein
LPFAIPEFLELAGAAVTFLAWLILLGILYSYRATLGYLLGQLASLLGSWHLHIPGVIDSHPLAFLANALDALNNAIRRGIEAAVTTTEQAGVWMLEGAAKLTVWAAYETEHLALDVAGAFKRLTVDLPHLKWLKALRWLAGFASVAALGHAIIKRLGLGWLTRYGSLSALGHAILRRLHLGWLAKYGSVGALVTAGFAIALQHWTGFTAKQLRRYLRRLRILGYLSGYATLAALGGAILKKLNLSWLRAHASAAALVGAALATLGLTWTRCNNTGKTGNTLCGMDSDLLDLLLLDTLAIVGAVSLVEFAHDVQDITEPCVDIMRGFIREF